MKFLITGGAGFIGGHLSESLIADGHHVTAIDNLSTGSINNLAKISGHQKFSFIKDDILTMNGVEQLVGDHDQVIHLAAAVGVELVVKDPVHTIETNVHGTERMLKATAKTGRRIIIASTSEVYGKSSKSHFSEKDDLLIGCPTNSRWSYACSKLLDEFYLMAYHRDMGLNGTIVRFFNTVGPRQTGQYGMVVPRFVAAALRNEPIPVYGDGNQSRCFCHVFDTVRALRLLADANHCNGKIFNIGSTHRISIRQLAEFVIERLNSNSKLSFIPYEEAYEKGFEDMLHRAPDINAINGALGWSPELTLEKIIDDVASSLKLSGILQQK